MACARRSATECTAAATTGSIGRRVERTTRAWLSLALRFGVTRRCQQFINEDTDDDDGTLASSRTPTRLSPGRRYVDVNEQVKRPPTVCSMQSTSRCFSPASPVSSVFRSLFRAVISGLWSLSALSNAKSNRHLLQEGDRGKGKYPIGCQRRIPRQGN